MRILGIVIGLVLFLALVLSSRGAWDASWSNLNVYGFIEPVHFSNLVDAVNERTDLLVQRAYPYAYPAAVTAHIEYVDCSSISTGRYACSTTTTTYVEAGVTNTIAYTNYCMHWTTICTTNDIKNDFIAGALLKAIDTKILQIIPYFVNQELEGTNHYSEWLSLTNMDFPYYTATGLFEVVGIMQSGKLYDVQSTGLYACGTVTTNIGTNTYVYTNYCMGYVTNVITNAYFHDTGTNGTVYDFVSASNLLERYRVLNKLAWVSGDRYCISTREWFNISDTIVDCTSWDYYTNAPSSSSNYLDGICDLNNPDQLIPGPGYWEYDEDYTISELAGGEYFLDRIIVSKNIYKEDDSYYYVLYVSGDANGSRRISKPFTRFSTNGQVSVDYYFINPPLDTLCYPSTNILAFNVGRFDYYIYAFSDSSVAVLDASYGDYEYYFSESQTRVKIADNFIKELEGLESHRFNTNCVTCEAGTPISCGDAGTGGIVEWPCLSQADAACSHCRPTCFDFYMTYTFGVSFQNNETINSFLSLLKYTPKFHE